MPFLSIGIPTYNRCDDLEILLNKLSNFIKDTFFTEDIELVISNNGSSDNTDKIISNFISTNEIQITLNENPKNLGFSKNILKSLSLRMQYIWFIGDDDLPEHEAIDKILSVLKNEKY